VNDTRIQLLGIIGTDGRGY